MDVKQGVGHLADYRSRIRPDVAHPERRGAELPVQRHLRAQVTVVVVAKAGNARVEVYLHDGEPAVHALLVEIAAVHRLVLRETPQQVHLVGGHAGNGLPRCRNHRHEHFAGAVIAAECDVASPGEGGRQLPLITQAERAHHAGTGAVAASEQAGEHVALHDGVVARTDLEDVVLGRDRELVPRIAAEHVLPAAASLKGPVAPSVSPVDREAVLDAELPGRPQPQMRAEPFHLVGADQLGIRAYAQLADVIIAVDERVDYGVEVFVKGDVLDFVDHGVDVLLLAGERGRTHRGPELLALVAGVGKDLHRGVAGADVGAVVEVGFVVGHLAAADEGEHLARVAQAHGEVDVKAVGLVEPCGIGQALVGRLHHEVAQPVDVHRVLHGGVDALNGEVLGIDAHLPVEGRGGYHGLGMIAYHQRLAPVHHQRVDYVVVVVEQRRGHYGRGELHVEGVHEIVVEVDLEVHAAGELAEEVVVGIDARNPVGLDVLGVHLGTRAVHFLRHGLGYHYGKVRHAAHRRGVDVIEDEAELAAEARVLQLLAGVREVELHLVVDLHAVVGMAVGVVPGTVGVDVRKKAPRLLVVSLHVGALELVVGKFQHEIDGREGAGLHLLPDGVIAEQLGYQHLVREVPVLEIVVAVEVGGYAHRGAFEHDRGEGDALAVLVRHPASHLGGLGEGG